MMLNSKEGIPKGWGSRQLGEPWSQPCSPHLAVLSWLNIDASQVVFGCLKGRDTGGP